MPKRGRPPKNKSMDDLDPAIRSEVDEAIRSDANESASSIFRRFGLATRGILIGTFIKYAGRIRKTEWTEPPEITTPPSAKELVDQLMIVSMQSALSGAMKPTDAAALIARMQEYDRLQIIRDAETRAAEIHDAKMAELRKAQEQALEVTTNDVRLTPEQVREIRLKVLGIA
ncbi:MAG: hypothetical protein KF841_14215 [Phycisphaerae bacterium]|nr:hypothetical protein [Phycisphaerae bacterium]